MIQLLLPSSSSSSHYSRRAVVACLFLFTSICSVVVVASHPESLQTIPVNSLPKLSHDQQTTHSNNNNKHTKIVIKSEDEIILDPNPPDIATTTTTTTTTTTEKEDITLVEKLTATNTVSMDDKTLKRKLKNLFKNNIKGGEKKVKAVENNETVIEEGEVVGTNTTTNPDEVNDTGEMTPEAVAGNGSLNQTDPLVTNTTVTTPTNASQSSSNDDPNETSTPTSSPTIENNCDASSCGGCKSLSGTTSIQDKDKSCVWDTNNGCVELSLKDNNDPNLFDFSCEDVGGLSSNVDSAGDQTEKNKNTDNSNRENGDSEKESKDKSTIAFVLVVFVSIGGFVIRKTILERSNRSNQNTNMNATSDIFGPSSGLSGRPNSEIVPLASGDDWDWDDNNGGDVELSFANKKVQEEEKEDLEMAMAISLSEKSDNENYSKTKSVQKSKPFLQSTNISPAPKTNIASNDSWDDESGWDDDSGWDADLPIQNTSNHKIGNVSTPFASSSISHKTDVLSSSSLTSSTGAKSTTINSLDKSILSTTSSTVVSPPTKPKPPPAKLNNDDIQSLLRETGSQITSLGKKNTVPKPTVQRKKPVEDDIFASMGLSSFNESKPKPSTKPAPTSAQSLPSNFSNTFSSTPSNALTADVGVDDGSNWDDDGDLDDLFDD